MDSLSTAFYKTRLESCVPLDQAAYVIDLQFFGDSILVSPVTQNATSVTEYFPKEYFYDFKFQVLRDHHQRVAFENTNFTQIRSAFVESPSFLSGFRCYDDGQFVQDRLWDSRGHRC